MANRIEEAIARIDAGLKDKNPRVLDGLSGQVGANFQELCRWQELKSLAQAQGIMTQEEALTVYEILGGEAPSPAKFDKRTLAEKAVVTHLAWELECSLSGKVKAAAKSATPRKRARRDKGQ